MGGPATDRSSAVRSAMPEDAYMWAISFFPALITGLVTGVIALVGMIYTQYQDAQRGSSVGIASGPDCTTSGSGSGSYGRGTIADRRMWPSSRATTS